MSDTKTFPAVRILISFGLGIAAAAGCLAGSGWLMAEQGLTQEAAAPLATAAVCLGGFCGGFFLAILQKDKGLVWGLTEGALFAGALVLLGTLHRSEWQTEQFIRVGLVSAAGMLGGILGMLGASRRRR